MYYQIMLYIIILKYTSSIMITLVEASKALI